MTGRHRAMALASLALALALAILAQFYFLRRPEYRWDGVFLASLAALCFVLSWRLATPRPAAARPARSPSASLGTWLWERRGTVGLTGLGLFLSLVATWLARSRAWNQDTTVVVVLWLMGIGAVLAAAFWPGSGAPFASGPPKKCHSEEAKRPKNLCSRTKGDARRCLASFSMTGLRLLVSSGAWRKKRERLLEVGGVALLTVLALGLRATALDRIPYTLAGDEAWFGLSARQVIQGVLRNPFVTGHLSMPTLFFWPMAWAMRLVGDNVAGLRLPSALVGAATVPLLYLLVRDLWGRRTACLSAVFLATYEYHVNYSRLALNNAWDPFFAVLTFWLMERGLAQTGDQLRQRCFLLTGLVLGVGLYFYPGARLLPILVVACLLFFSIQRRAKAQPAGLTGTAVAFSIDSSWAAPAARAGSPDPALSAADLAIRREQTGPCCRPCNSPRLTGPVVLLGLALLVAAGPILGFALAHPDDWNARMNQIGILQSGWLQLTRQLTGRSTAYLLADQFLRAAGAFHVFPDRTDFFGIRRPLLAFFPAVLALLGMAWALAHVRERRYFLVVLWFWAVIVTGGMLTESPPSSQRLLLAVPAVALLVATGLEQSVGLARRLLGVDRRWADLLLGLLLFAVAVNGIRFYLAEYIPSARYGSENGETATMIGHYAQELDAGYRTFFFGPPRLGWSFGSMAFLAPQVAAQDVVEPLRAPPDFVDAGRDATFLFLPERLGELAWVQAEFPAGRVREFYDSKGRLRFTAYEVGP